MVTAKTFNSRLALAAIIVLGIALAYALRPFLTGLFAAFILFFLLSPLHRYLVRRRWRRSIAALLLMLLSFVVIVAPLSFLGVTVISQAGQVIGYNDEIMEIIGTVDEVFPEIDIRGQFEDRVPSILGGLRSLIVYIFTGFANALLNIFFMYFLLFYLLVYDKEFCRRMTAFIPFSEKNSRRIMDEFSRITRSTVITTGIVAAIQSAILTVGLIAVGVQGALVWGFIGFILAFLPVVGISFLWAPASVVLFLQGDPWGGLIILLVGAFASSIDNLIRPYIQMKVGSVHSLVIFIGVITGIPLFGLIGIFMGPILVSLFVMMLRMYNEEYVTNH